MMIVRPTNTGHVAANPLIADGLSHAATETPIVPCDIKERGLGTRAFTPRRENTIAASNDPSKNGAGTAISCSNSETATAAKRSTSHIKAVDRYLEYGGRIMIYPILTDRQRLLLKTASRRLSPIARFWSNVSVPIDIGPSVHLPKFVVDWEHYQCSPRRMRAYSAALAVVTAFSAPSFCTISIALAVDMTSAYFPLMSNRFTACDTGERS